MAYLYKGNMPDSTVINIKEGTTIINESAFEGNQNLIAVTIPASMDSLCSFAFAGCIGLTEIRCYAETTPKTAPDAFGSLSGSNTTLYVPDNAVDEYKAHAVWGKFQVKGLSELNQEGAADYVKQAGGDDADGIRSTNSDAWTSEVYDLSGRRQIAPQHGMNIIRMSDGSTRKVMVK